MSDFSQLFRDLIGAVFLFAEVLGIIYFVMSLPGGAS